MKCQNCYILNVFSLTIERNYLSKPYTQHWFNTSVSERDPCNGAYPPSSHYQNSGPNDSQGDTSYDIQIKYGLTYCVTCPSMSTDPGSLPKPVWVAWSQDPYKHWAGWHSLGKTYLISIIAQVLEIVFIPPLCSNWHEGGHSISWKCWPVIRSTAHQLLMPQPLLLIQSMTLTAERGWKP